MRVGISAVSERIRRLRHKCGTEEHERDRSRHIRVGGDGACLHRDLFYHPIFDGGVITRRANAFANMAEGDSPNSTRY
jgi:hypothetical protein